MRTLVNNTRLFNDFLLVGIFVYNYSWFSLKHKYRMFLIIQLSGHDSLLLQYHTIVVDLQK